MKNPQTTIATTFLTHIISAIDGVRDLKFWLHAWEPDILTSDEKVVPIQAQKSKFSKVRVGKMADTLVLKVESEGVFESDLRSVWIFELGQKLTEIATFYIIFLRKGFLNEEKLVISILSYRSVNVKKEKRKGKEFSWKRLICKGNKWTGLFFQ